MLRISDVCTFDQGDGIGGSQKHLGETTSENECAILVRSQEPTANGASHYQESSKNCFANFGMTGTDSNSDFRSCLFTGQLRFFQIQHRIS